MRNPYENILSETMVDEDSQGKLSTLFVIVSLLANAYDENDTDYDGGNPWRFLFDVALKDYADCEVIRKFRTVFNNEYERGL
jgi:hypothetical protein